MEGIELAKTRRDGLKVVHDAPRVPDGVGSALQRRPLGQDQGALILELALTTRLGDDEVVVDRVAAVRCRWADEIECVCAGGRNRKVLVLESERRHPRSADEQHARQQHDEKLARPQGGESAARQDAVTE